MRRRSCTSTATLLSSHLDVPRAARNHRHFLICYAKIVISTVITYNRLLLLGIVLLNDSAFHPAVQLDRGVSDRYLKPAVTTWSHTKSWCARLFAVTTWSIFTIRVTLSLTSCSACPSSSVFFDPVTLQFRPPSHHHKALSFSTAFLAAPPRVVYSARACHYFSLFRALFRSPLLQAFAKDLLPRPNREDVVEVERQANHGRAEAEDAADC